MQDTLMTFSITHILSDCLKNTVNKGIKFQMKTRLLTFITIKFN